MKFTPYHAAIVSLLSQKKDLNILVVGANDAKVNDPLYGILSSISEKVFVNYIEPVTHLHDEIDLNLSGVLNQGSYQIHSRIVSETSEETTTLFAIKKAYWNSVAPTYAKGWPEWRAALGISSIHREKVEEWFDKWKVEEVAEDPIEEIVIPNRTLTSLISEITIQPIDVIQIDIEGEDANVICSADFVETLKPSIIYFEGTKNSGDGKRITSHLSPMYKIFWVANNGVAIRTND